jgi:hypothetical protein
MINLPPFGPPVPIDASVASTIVVIGAPALTATILACGVVAAIVAAAVWRARLGRRSARRPARAPVANVAGARG